MKKVPRGKHHNTNGKRLKKKRYNKKKKLNKRKIAIVILIIIIVITLIVKKSKNKTTVETTTNQVEQTASEQEENKVEGEPANEQNKNQNQDQGQQPEKEITDWRLTLANYETLLPENFTVKVENIDKTRQFDARAIGELNDMMNQMKMDGITNIWIQSAYRSVARQKELYDASVKKYLQEGKTQEEAEKLTNEYINKPGSSDHNLGLAVDFNKVDNEFEKLEGFKWLQKNAENYGFVLRYPKDKEDITKIAYESWHWRYVGVEHAKKMNELNMCLEEYIKYLKTH